MTEKGVLMMGTDRMFTKEDILDFAKKYGFEPVDISELDVNRQGGEVQLLESTWSF
jgi:hypothetical protein